MKRAERTPRAKQDVKDIVRYYAGESVSVANLFLLELKRAISRIEAMPKIGFLRFARELDIGGLRAYPLQNFPYLLFYFEYEDRIDLVRVLHTHRDVFGIYFDI